VTGLTAAEVAALPVAREAVLGPASVLSPADAVVFALSRTGFLLDPAAALAPSLDRLGEISAREAGAWRGPWTVQGIPGTAFLEISTPDGPVAQVSVHLAESAQFIAGARADVADLLTEIYRLQAEINRSDAAQALAALHPQECPAGQHRGWMAIAADGPLPCPWCRIAELSEAALAAPQPGVACGTPGCGSLDGYLDTSTQYTAGWVRVGVNGRQETRWYCTMPCASQACGSSAQARPAPAAASTDSAPATTGPVTEAELLAVWERGATRLLWHKAHGRALADGDSERLAMAQDQLQDLPYPLDALAANAALGRKLAGQRWYVVMLAREYGSPWADIATALGEPDVDLVRADYTAAIERQEKYTGDLHDAARARAVLAADEPAAADRGGLS
jgi:hypothetical protein